MALVALSLSGCGSADGDAAPDPSAMEPPDFPQDVVFLPAEPGRHPLGQALLALVELRVLHRLAEAPETTAGLVGEWAQAGQVNVLGGCCGSTPAHIAEMARAVAGLTPRQLPDVPPAMRLAGLDCDDLSKNTGDSSLHFPRKQSGTATPTQRRSA